MLAQAAGSHPTRRCQVSGPSWSTSLRVRIGGTPKIWSMASVCLRLMCEVLHFAAKCVVQENGFLYTRFQIAKQLSSRKSTSNQLLAIFVTDRLWYCFSNIRSWYPSHRRPCNFLRRGTFGGLSWSGVGQYRSFDYVLHMTFLAFLVVDLLLVTQFWPRRSLNATKNHPPKWLATEAKPNRIHDP